MTERDLISAAWYCVRDSEKIPFEELTDRLKALHGSGCTDAQRVLAKGLAMAVWDWLEKQEEQHEKETNN